MKTILFGLLQVILASGILYGYYHLMLRNKKFHQYNRFYLLASVIISVVIPFLTIPVYLGETEIQSSMVLQTLQTISSVSPESEPVTTSTSFSTAISTPFNWNVVLYTVYWAAASLLFIRMLISLKKILAIIKKNPVEDLNGIRFINTVEPGTPYSFFRWLFWNKKIELRSEKGEQIFRHEIFHIQQRHSVDIIFMELLTVVFWINPFFHLMKKEIKAIHEFLADQFASHKAEKWEYAELLLMQALNTQQHLVNPFFHNQIKRRIAMITNPKKTSHRYLRKLLVLPVMAVVVILFAFKFKHKDAEAAIRSDDPITIVIDAGHGGIDPGVTSKDGKYTEAQLTLEIAKEIGRLAKEYNIKVWMTRQDMNLPGNAVNVNDGLKNRIEVCEKAMPLAFISIHMNNDDQSNSQGGFEAAISGKKEIAASSLLASTFIQNISSVYKINDKPLKLPEGSVFILDKNLYPAVFLQCGYISNADDLAFITRKENQEKLARSILEGIVKYKKQLTDLNKGSSTEEANTATLDGTIKMSKIDSVNSREPSKIIINGKEFKIKEVKIEGMESSKIVTADLHISTRLSGKDTTYPLIILDGVKQAYGSNLANIDPASIESVNVFKGPTAITKYGKDGKNGVIEIFTRKKNNQQIKELTLEETPIQSDNKVFEKVEIEAAFPGGERAWKKILETTLNTSIPVQNHAPAGEYTVYIQFIVHTDGSISDIKALTNHGFGMEEEAKRIIKNSPRWTPAIQNGRTVNAYVKQRVDFVVGKEKTVTFIKKWLSEITVVGYASSNPDQHASSPGTIHSLPVTEEGSPEWRKFFERNLNPNAPINEGWAVSSYTIVIQFALNKDGTLSEIKALTFRDSKTAAHCIDVVKHVQGMLPQEANKTGQQLYFVQPFTFQILSEKEVG